MVIVYALTVRGSTHWLCSALDHNGIPRLWTKGATEAEARQQAELAVTEYRERKQSYRLMEPRGRLGHFRSTRRTSDRSATN
jgi:hypothetical protein